MNTITAIAVSVPTSLLIMSTVAGDSGQVTQGDKESVRRAMLMFGATLILASLLTRNVGVTVGTTLSVGTAFYGLQWAWGGI